MGTAVQRAFELIASGSQTLYEIIWTTVRMALSSSAISILIGAPIGILIGASSFRGKGAVTAVLRTLMGIPPVVVGIIVYILFSGTGPFGSLGLIYSVELMIIAQVILIVPIAAGMTETAVSAVAPKLNETAKGLRMSGAKRLLLCANESRRPLVAAWLFCFARAMAEVGAVQIVGGNILHKTRVMTTAIALNYNTGDFTYAVALGLILLVISLSVNCVAALLQVKKHDN